MQSLPLGAHLAGAIHGRGGQLPCLGGLDVLIRARIVSGDLLGLSTPPPLESPNGEAMLRLPSRRAPPTPSRTTTVAPPLVSRAPCIGRRGRSPGRDLLSPPILATTPPGPRANQLYATKVHAQLAIVVGTPTSPRPRDCTPDSPAVGGVGGRNY